MDNPELVAELVERNIQLSEARETIQELENKNTKLKSILNTLADDLAGVLKLEFYAYQLCESDQFQLTGLVEENKILRSQLQASDNLRAGLGKITAEKDREIESLKRDYEQFEKDYDHLKKETTRQIKELQDGYNALLHTASTRISELIKKANSL